MRLLRLIISVALTALMALAAHADSPTVARPGSATAIFAGGCFWCVEQDFERLPGVIEAYSGYTGGRTPNPSYEQVSRELTGHTEAVMVYYDPKRVSYRQLLDHFWRRIDPTVKDRQFCDIGNQYRSGIYWATEDERKAAEDSRDALLKSGKFKTIHTEIVQATAFWMAEDYHQDYYKKNPIRYSFYRMLCGRDARVEEVWGGK